MYCLGRCCVFYSSSIIGIIIEANAKCYRHMMKSRPCGLLLRDFSVSFLSGPLLSFPTVLRLVFLTFIFTSRIYTYQMVCDVRLILSLVSNSRSVSLLICKSSCSLFQFCQIPSQLMFILSLVSDSGSRLIECKNSTFIALTLPYFLHTACCVFVYLYPSRTPPQQSDKFLLSYFSYVTERAQQVIPSNEQ